MAVTFDAEGNIVLNDPDVFACPTDPMEALECESCQ